MVPLFIDLELDRSCIDVIPFNFLHEDVTQVLYLLLRYHVLKLLLLLLLTGLVSDQGWLGFSRRCRFQGRFKCFPLG